MEFSWSQKLYLTPTTTADLPRNLLLLAAPLEVRVLGEARVGELLLEAEAVRCDEAPLGTKARVVLGPYEVMVGDRECRRVVASGEPRVTLEGQSHAYRGELVVTLDFPESGVSGDATSLTAPSASQTLEMQGLPDVVTFNAQQQLGAEAAAQLTPDAWRDVAAALAADPTLIGRSATFTLPASSPLAAGLQGEGPAEMRNLAKRLADDGKFSRNWDWGFLVRPDATTRTPRWP